MPAFQVQLIIPAMSHSAATSVHEGPPPYWQRQGKLPRDGVERVGSSKLRETGWSVWDRPNSERRGGACGIFQTPRDGVERVGSSKLKAYVIIIMMMMGKLPRDGVERVFFLRLWGNFRETGWSVWDLPNSKSM